MPPDDLSAAACDLWRAIVRQRPAGFYSAGDLPLLREYVHNCAVLIPKANELVAEEFSAKHLDARDKLVRQTASLAVKLRICVSSRTRPDTAAMRDSVHPRGRKSLDRGYNY